MSAKLHSDLIEDFIDIEGNLQDPDSISFRVLINGRGWSSEFPLSPKSKLGFDQLDKHARLRLIAKMKSQR